MRRRTLLIAALGTVIVVGVAISLQNILWSPPSDTEVSIPPSETESDSNAATPDEAPNSDANLSKTTAFVVEDSGTLERLENGQWRSLKKGVVLSVDDRVRTSSRGSASLKTPDGSRIDFIDEVEVSVETLTKSLAELELHRGRLRADLKKGSGLSLRVRSSGATAEAKNGAFVVFADGTGMVAVASETAEVQLRARDREVIVAAGEQSVVGRDGVPADPERIPDEVYLSVAWPQRRLRREKRLVVQGRVSPGSEVRVAGQAARVASDGAFEADVELENGVNRISVEARDPLGRARQVDSPALTVKNRPPVIEVLSQGSWEEEDATN